jgi:uncharacterized protein YjiS (DUF1127 family)
MLLSLDASSMEAVMSDASTMHTHASGRRLTTMFDSLLAAAARGLGWLIAAIADELRIRRDMRLLAAMDDHMLKDIGLCRCEIESCVRCGRNG